MEGRQVGPTGLVRGFIHALASLPCESEGEKEGGD